MGINKKMDSYFLVTTALEESWKVKAQTLFLGDWCLIFNKFNKDNYPSHKINNYHWDDREKYNQDFHFIDKLYEKKLKELNILLNKFHGTDKNIRYWRIVIGPWLRSFIEVLFDRYEILKSIKNEISDTIILDYEIDEFIPLNYIEFYSQIKSDEWNHMIFSEIIQFLNIPYSKSQTKLNQKTDTQKPLAKKIKTIGKNYFLKMYSILITKPLNRILIKDPYMPIFNEFKLNFQFFQLPIRTPESLIKKPKKIENRYSIETLKSNNDFEKLLNKLLISLLPFAYFENFEKIKKEANFYYPSKPKIIFTSNAYQHDDHFKIMTAERSLKNIPYVIGQHGGNFKTGLNNQTLLHQLKSCNNFFSWGWTDKALEENKIIKMPSLKLSRKISPPNGKGYILITSPSYPRYFYCHFSIPVSGQFLKIINGTIDFVNNLNGISSEMIKLKLDSDVFGWKVNERFISQGFSDILSNGENFYELCSKSRISVSTYNSTIYYETLSSNFPTIIFFDTNFYEISKESMEDFDLLKSVGIFHESPLLASNFINSIFNNIDDWWLKKEVQDARKIFCDKYAFKSKSYLKDWKNSINNILEK